MSLEVDGRHGGVPILSQREEEGFIYPNELRTHWVPGQNIGGAQPDTRNHDTEASKLTRRSYGKKVAVPFRVVVFWSVVLCLFAVLAAVTAGVAGSVATRRGRNLDSCMSNLQKLDTANNANDPSTANKPSTATNSSTADNSNSQGAIPVNNPSTANGSSTADNSNSQASQDSDPESFISTSDCSALNSPYIPTLTSMALTSSNISFNIKCDTDYSDPDADFLSVAVFTFEDCIAACASFNERLPHLHPNLTCYIASYGLNLREVSGGASPSCRLKASKDIAPAARPGVAYSALLITG